MQNSKIFNCKHDSLKNAIHYSHVCQLRKLVFVIFMKIWKVSFTIYGFVVWNFPSSPDGGRRRGLASAGCPPPWACGSRTEAALLSCVSDLNHMALPGITSWLGGRSNECPNKRLTLFLLLISSVCWLSISFTVVLTKANGIMPV